MSILYSSQEQRFELLSKVSDITKDLYQAATWPQLLSSISSQADAKLAELRACIDEVLALSIAAEVPSFTVNVPSENMQVPLGGGISFSAVEVIGGLAPYTYQWYFNEVVIAGSSTGPALTMTSSAKASHAGGYYVVVTDSAGSSIKSNVCNVIVGQPVTE